jgi:hypothetical protein
MEAECQGLLCRLSVACKAMEHSGDLIASLSKNGPGVSLSFPAVNNQRQPKFSSQRDLTSKHLSLKLNGREIVMVIQPDFTNRSDIVLLFDNSAYMCCQVILSASPGARLMRMDSAGKAH